MRLAKIIERDLLRSWKRFAGVGLAVAASVAVLVVLGAVALGIHAHVIGPLLPQLPLELLKVEPRTVSLGVFSFDAGSVGGGLGEDALERMKDIDGVTAVYPVLGAKVPLRAEGGEGFIGKRLRTDIFATGVPLELVADEVAEGEKFEDTPGGPVPVIIARRLLELYNTTVAPSLDKPRLSERMAIGFEMLLTIGRSHSGGAVDPGKIRKIPARVVGFADQASLVGLTVPEATMRRWNAEFGQPSPVTGAWVRLASPDRAGEVSSRLEQRGLKVDDTAKLIGAGLAVGAGIVGAFGLVVLGLAAFAIAQTFFLVVAERRTELAIFRALGTRRKDLRRLIFLEAAVLGALGALAGLGLGVAVALGLDHTVLGALPELPFQPSSIVSLQPLLLIGALLLGTLSAVLGALFPAFRAGRADPATTLRS